MTMKIPFTTPVDASRYLDGFGTATGALLHSINYDQGTYRFSLVASDDTVSPIVNGTDPADTVSEAAAAADIRAEIASTLS